ncbi:MAG: metal-sulfur cluster assembly factor [Sulfurihydrogenibium sp.]|uniref:metal-sulfur cluster assembly factor n=1 Tax=Sulfurihydrogenibium sp. TaxID=2053621 RepID=UPI003C7B169E
MVQKIYKIMKDIYDPEIPLNFIDLGLIKSITLNGNEVNIVMTLTSPECPLKDVIVQNIQSRILSEIENVEKVNIYFDFTKVWTASNISKEGREKLKKLGWNL